MNIDVLREFAEVARQQSFSKAAHGFYLSQPTLSKHIAALEAEVGSALILRAHGKVSLTPAGEVFLEGATRILGEFDATMSQINQLNGKRFDKIVVALQTDIDAHLKIYSKSIQIARSLFEESRPNSVVAVMQQEDGYVERLAKGQWDACFVIDVQDARVGAAEASRSGTCMDLRPGTRHSRERGSPACQPHKGVVGRFERRGLSRRQDGFRDELPSNHRIVFKRERGELRLQREHLRRDV